MKVDIDRAIELIEKADDCIDHGDPVMTIAGSIQTAHRYINEALKSLGHAKKPTNEPKAEQSNPGDCDWLDGSHDGEECPRHPTFGRCYREFRRYGHISGNVCRNRRKRKKDRRGEQLGSVIVSMNTEELADAYPEYDRRESCGRRKED